MAVNECMYFYEDEVYRVTKKGNLEYGMVLQNADVDSDEEHSDQEEFEKLKNGHILVAWHPRGQEDVIHEKKVGLSDRCLMPGDIVRRLVPGQDTQRGYCRSIKLTATVQVVGTRQVIYHVNSEDLVPLEEFAPDIAICLDAWVGIINAVTSEVELQFADGSVAVLNDDQAAELDDPSGRRLTDSEFRVWFYPGQRLTGPMRAFEHARWNQCNHETQQLKSKRNRNVKVTVTGYRMTSLKVHWQCRAVTAEGSLDQPAFMVTGDDLKRVRMLNVFEPCTLQLGDMNTYVLKEGDLVMSVEEWKWLEKETLKANKKGRGAPGAAARGRHVTSATNPATSTSTTTSTTSTSTTPGAATPGAAGAAMGVARGVVQALHNGREDDMGSVSSYSSRGSAGKRPRRVPALKTIQAKKKKLKRSRPCRHPVVETRSFSVGDRLVVETVKTESTVTVVWQDGSVEEDLPSVSLHPSHHLDEHEFFPGDFVVEQQKSQGPTSLSEYGVVQRVDHVGRIAEVNWYRVYLTSTQDSPQLLRQSEVAVYDLTDHPDFRYRPGTVVISVSPQNRVFGDGWKTADDGKTPTETPNGTTAETSAEDSSRCHGNTSQPKPDADQHMTPASPSITEVSKPTANSDSKTQDSTAAPVTNGGGGASASEDAAEPMQHDSADGMTPQEDMADVSTTETISASDATMEQRPTVEGEGTEGGSSGKKAPAGCSHAGQVLDVLTSGQVKVWWADGTVSNCYPQDLFRVGEYDSDEGELWDNNDSQSVGSEEWETESEESILAGDVSSTPAATPDGPETDTSDPLKPRLAAIIEKLSIHIAKLESMFSQNARLSSSWSNKILDIYSNSRCLDRLMDTSFFDGLQFTELVAKIRERGASGGDADNHTSGGGGGGGFSGGGGGGGGVLGTDCGQLCAAIKSQLMLAYEEVVRRYGSAALVADSATNEPSAAANDSANTQDSATTGDSGITGDDDFIAKDEEGKSSEEVMKSVEEVEEEHMETSAGAGVDEGAGKLVDASGDAKSPDVAANDEDATDVQGITIISEEPLGHRYVSYSFPSAPGASFLRAVRRDLSILRSSLPPGIAVKGWDSRLDLLSALVTGPRDTPYEDGLFVFDILLGGDYPQHPPTFHYHSYCQDRLNPNLYEDGKVCVSLLGTWGGKGSQVWTSTSSLLQVLVSVQGLILAAEPYYNEAGYERQRGSQQGRQNSRLYNERVLLKLVQSLTNMARHPPEVFKPEVEKHLRRRGKRLVKRLQHWIQQSGGEERGQCPEECDGEKEPGFPLLPTSRGCQMALTGALADLEKALAEQGLSDSAIEPTSNSAETSTGTGSAPSGSAPSGCS